MVVAEQRETENLRLPTEPSVGSGSYDQVPALQMAIEQLRKDLADCHSALMRVSGERDHLIALINQVPDQLFVKDLDSRFVVANQAVVADKLFVATGVPVTVETLIGKTDFDLFPAAVAQGYRDIESQIMQLGLPMIGMMERNVHADGRDKWVSMTKAPLRDADGNVIGLVGVAQDVTLRKEAEDRVRFMAHHDLLTGLPNRALFMDHLDQAILQANEGSSSFALVFLDLDNFKWVNDTLGHQAGDQLLSVVSSRLSACVRASDTVARLGGDEFVILLSNPPLDVDQLTSLVERVRKSVAAPVEIAGHTFNVTTSQGVARFPSEGKSRDELLAKADAVMYESKKKGRNTVSFATS